MGTNLMKSAETEEIDHPALEYYSEHGRAYAVMCAWMHGKLGEGQACKLIGCGRHELHEHRKELLEIANVLWKRHEQKSQSQ